VGGEAASLTSAGCIPNSEIAVIFFKRKSILLGSISVPVEKTVRWITKTLGKKYHLWIVEAISFLSLIL